MKNCCFCFGMSCSIFGYFLSEQTKKMLIFTDLFKMGIVLLICGYALLCHDKKLKKKRALKIMTVARRHMQIFNNGAI